MKLKVWLVFILISYGYESNGDVEDSVKKGARSEMLGICINNKFVGCASIFLEDVICALQKS